jgi:hypothetical protein
MTKHNIESSTDNLTKQAGGYGVPPVAHRFRKGRSGNPAGRPRRATGAPGDRLPGADEPTRAMILEEAYRPVTVREGDEEVSVSVHRAVFRAMAEAAMKGNQTAQHRWTQLVQAAEARQKRDQIALYNVLEREGRDREWSDREGGMRVRVSYGDEVIVDSQSGTVVVRDMAGTGEGEA